jgi:alkaline phosphatase D
MRYYPLFSILIFLSISSCQNYTSKNVQSKSSKSDFILAFGSGNNQRKDNPFWEAIQNQKPNVWVWEGDAIYSDTEDMNVLSKNYSIQKNKPDYQKFIQKIPILGTWDDHEYGVNDGGAEYPKKEESQQLFLDFLDVPANDIRRKQAGVYYSKNYTINAHQIKIILLDTRYFRTELTEDRNSKKRYKPNPYGSGTMLGEKQWNWLKNELNNSKADFNVIMSSIQFLSEEHGFEAWGTMPHERDKLEKLIIDSKAKGVFILSGDRHISEISRKNIGNRLYPLYDFTSSGLTHSYNRFSGEPNKYRITPVVYQKSYGIVRFNLTKHRVKFEMWGEKAQLLQSLSVQF